MGVGRRGLAELALTNPLTDRFKWRYRRQEERKVPTIIHSQHKEVQVRRPAQVAYVLAALFALVAVVALVVRPIHYERTLALGAILAVAAGAFGYWKSRGKPKG